MEEKMQLRKHIFTLLQKQNQQKKFLEAENQIFEQFCWSLQTTSKWIFENHYLDFSH